MKRKKEHYEQRGYNASLRSLEREKNKKKVVHLYSLQESVNETAEELDVAVSTVKNQKARGIKLLKAKLT